MSPSAAAAQERSPISFFLPHKQEVWPQVALCITPGGRSKSSPYCDSDDAGAVDHGDDVALCTYLTHNSLCFREAIISKKCSFFEHCSKGL